MPSKEHVDPIELGLESSDLVLRGLTGEEHESAVLNGQVILNLTEPTSIREISLVFSGSAKVQWRDSSSHHFEHPLFYHDFTFLNPSSSTSGQPHASSSKHHHQQAHTLQSGRHVFPFSLHVPGSLPATLRTYSGSCVIEYKCKATAIRPGLSTDWKARKAIRISRTFAPDAAEYTQTLEIENTWPGKVMYAFTMPHKAFAAGDTIPVSVKFSPIAKGVRIMSLVTSIREHTTVHSKNSSHAEARDATTVKYNFVGNQPQRATPGSLTPSSRVGSSASLSALGSAANSSQASASGSMSDALHARLRLAADAARAGEGEPQVETIEDDGEDMELDVVVEIPIPIWTCPTHTVHPCFIQHKIKWSAFIKNPDGHVSELRCALPIHILAHNLVEEARLASAGTRTLLFGESGVLTRSDVPQADLPSYQDHVLDRVANAETASYYPVSAGFALTPWSHRSTPVHSPGHSPPSSRPSSPHRTSSHRDHFPGFSAAPTTATTTAQRLQNSGGNTPILSPVTPGTPGEFVDPEHPEDHRNWVDSELIGTLTLDHTSPPGSTPGSRPSSRPASRAGSRAPSPDHSSGHNTPASTSAPSSLHERRSGTSSPFFHLHIPKPLRPLTSFSRGSSSGNVSSGASPSPRGSDGGPSASALSNALAAHAARMDRTFGGSGGPAERAAMPVHTHSAMSNSPNVHSSPSAAGSPVSTSPVQSAFSINTSVPSSSRQVHSANPSSLSQSPALESLHAPASSAQQPANTLLSDFDALSAVPSYDIAARGFLGGGPTPIHTGLPNYEDSERT